MTNPHDKALLRCPFCGGEALFHKVRPFGAVFKVSCKNCDAGPHGQLREIDAVRLWNTRAPIEAVNGGGGWLDIASAPKDGTVVQAWHTVHKCPISVLWKEEGHSFNGEVLHWYERSYTTAWPERCFSHWRPLPPPPSPSHEGEKQP